MRRSSMAHTALPFDWEDVGPVELSEATKEYQARLAEILANTEDVPEEGKE